MKRLNLLIFVCTGLVLLCSGMTYGAAQTAGALQTIQLKAPDLSDANILGYNVGLRPYRKSGVRLETEELSGKLLVHNYGYGGSGLTLCWGGAQEAVSLVEESLARSPQPRDVAVLGAGVIGLATAYDLVHKGYRVRIYAQDFSPNLTSNVAAGIWSPPVIDESLPAEIRMRLQRMIDVSTARFLQSIAQASQAPEFEGIRFIDRYSFGNGGSNAFQHSVGGAVQICFDTGTVKTGSYTQEISIDGGLFMADLERKVRQLGVPFEQRVFKASADVAALPEPIIINCTSLGSRELFGDEDFRPVRGQLVYFKPQSEVTYTAYEAVPSKPNYWVTLYPLHDRILLGGVFELGKEELELDHEVLAALVAHGRACFDAAPPA